MDDSQREYHLREQLKAIRAELGEAYAGEAEADLFEDRIDHAGMPAEIEEEARREVDRLRRVHAESAEYTIIRTWLETVCDVPWRFATSDTASLHKASKALDRDHHALFKVKERILEYLAVRQLEPDSKGPILCFVGPPGVGKTSLGKSIASALGRRFGRIALGGIKDETEIRGHRRTYVGALPGRILRALIRSGSRNPVLVLDELDKVGNDFRGDPASALLEVLDPEQNHTFVDHYLDVPVDLSQVLFIGTANLIDPVPPALLDRLEIIEIPGYTEEEKAQIAKRHLLPKLAKNHGLTRKISIDARAVVRTIRDFTREAGVRDLERQLATVHRKVARRVVEGEASKVRVKPDDLQRYLGPRGTSRSSPRTPSRASSWGWPGPRRGAICCSSRPPACPASPASSGPACSAASCRSPPRPPCPGSDPTPRRWASIRACSTPSSTSTSPPAPSPRTVPPPGSPSRPPSPPSSPADPRATGSP